jgi:hypothetical protein
MAQNNDEKTNTNNIKHVEDFLQLCRKTNN